MSIATLGLALLAGVLSVLSPCVLPLLPIVLGTAASAHRLGPLALAAGLTISFTAIGLFVATSASPPASTPISSAPSQPSC
jgi:cytochrome c-type biogenesis protein